jgi:hypothetical protein
MAIKTIDRVVLTLARNAGVWSVDLEGGAFGHSFDKEVARAAAIKRARDIQDGGRACEVRVMGEPFFAR